MTITIPLKYDGQVFWPEEPISLPADTLVTATFELPKKKNDKPYIAFEVATSLNLDGPEDWSERLEDYLYNGLKNDE